jgi:hypothetical protein
MNTIKRTLVTALTVFAFTSSSAMAQGVKMSDEQLDQVTAAGAISVVAISNPGKANVGHNLEIVTGHATCVNCAELFPTPNGGRTAGVVVVVNRKFNLENPIIRCVGAGLPGLC